MRNEWQIRIGARGSKLSLTQAEGVAAQLRATHPGLDVRLVIIQTTGDQLRDISLTVLGGQGVFTKEIERALLSGEIDVAVHSLKDLPTTLPEGLQLAAITKRESPNDCLIAARPIELTELDGARIGTSSLRRQAQLLRLNPNLRMVELRGNVPTRIEKMLRGEADAIVLAAAGLARLNIRPPWIREFSFEEMLPAPGQGALGIEICADDEFAAQVVGALNNPAAQAACTAERAFLRAFGGGCRAPIAALGTVHGSTLHLDGLIASADALQYYRAQMEVNADRQPACMEAEQLGAELAALLKSHGAQSLVEEVTREEAPQIALPDVRSMESHLPLHGRRIVVTRDEDADGPMSSALRDLGGEPLIFPLLAEAPPRDLAPLIEAVNSLDSFDWIIFSSIRAVQALSRSSRPGRTLSSTRAKIACVGPRTAQAFAEETGRQADVIAEQSGAQGLLDTLSTRDDVAGARVLYPRSEQALPTLSDGLRAMQCEVIDPIAYRTARGSGFETITKLIERAHCDAVTFASPTAVQFFVEAIGVEAAAKLSQQLAFASIGPTTSSVLRQHNLRIAVEATEKSYKGLAEALANYFIQ